MKLCIAVLLLSFSGCGWVLDKLGRDVEKIPDCHNTPNLACPAGEKCVPLRPGGKAWNCEPLKPKPAVR